MPDNSKEFSSTTEQTGLNIYKLREVGVKH